MKKLIFFCVAILIKIVMVGQTIRYVKPTGLQGQGYQGPHSWQDHQAYRELQAAINDSQPGDEVWVAQGTYRPIFDSTFSIPSNPRWATYVLKEGVKVRGSFRGLPGDEGNATYQDVFTYTSYLSGDLYNNDPLYYPWPGAIQMYDSYIEDNAYSIVRNITPLSPNTILEHFAIKHAFYLDTNLFTNHPNGPYYGNGKVIGAVFLKDGASPILSNLIFIQNRGAVGNLPDFTHFIGGIQSAPGSAITVIKSTPIIQNCYFWRNFNGAAVAISNYPPIQDTVFIRDSYFIDNYGGDAGAAVFAYGSSKVSMINCLIYGNYSNYGSGLLTQGYWSSDPVYVTIQNCLYTQNNKISLAYPGRLFFLISNYGHGGSVVKVANSVIWDNGPKYTTANTPDGIFYEGQNTLLQIDNSLVQFGFPHLKSSNIIDADPKFVSLPSTNLSPLNFDYSNAFNVYSSSPLINPNLPQLYYNVLYDIKGNQRDNNPDLSCFEFIGPITSSAEEKQNIKFSILPKPANEFITITKNDFDTYILQINDLTGRKVYYQKFSQPAISIPIKHLNNGIYIVQLVDASNSVVHSEKFIKY